MFFSFNSVSSYYPVYLLSLCLKKNQVCFHQRMRKNKIWFYSYYLLEIASVADVKRDRGIEILASVRGGRGGYIERERYCFLLFLRSDSKRENRDWSSDLIKRQSSIYLVPIC